MRYRPNTPLILKNFNLKIQPGSRIGIVGRTGSGKSSLFSCILRIVELQRGLILIDNTNIASLQIQKLRKAITLIPQDPLVF